MLYLPSRLRASDWFVLPFVSLVVCRCILNNGASALIPAAPVLALSGGDALFVLDPPGRFVMSIIFFSFLRALLFFIFICSCCVSSSFSFVYCL